jgi:hypothetical protein
MTNLSDGFSIAGSIVTIDLDQVSAAITAINSSNGSNYAVWDTPGDNLEKLIHSLLVYAIAKSENNLDTVNLKLVSAGGSSSAFGSRGTLPTKNLTLAFPFTSDGDVLGDPDNLG